MDHIIPHRGDQKLFWDKTNWQAMSGPCHSRKTASEDGGFGNAPKGRAGTAEYIPAYTGALRARSPLRRSALPLTIVSGPPGAGKSTWVSERAAPGDVVIDLDEIIAELSGLPLYHAGLEWLSRGLQRRSELLASLAGAGDRTRHAWFIVSAPTKAERAMWKNALGAVQVVVIETPADACADRIRQDARRPAAVQLEHVSAARTWWTQYARRNGEIAVGPQESFDRGGGGPRGRVASGPVRVLDDFLLA